MHPLLYLLVAICLGVTGQLLMKHGTNVSGELSFTLASVRLAATNRFILGGLLAYALSSAFYIVVVSKLPLSYVYPMIAVSYVAVTILARFIFGEALPAMRCAGLAVICAGVLLLALSESNRSSPAATDATAVTQPAADQAERD